MSSGRSEATALLAAFVLSAALAAPARADEARGKHDSGLVVWRDEHGGAREARGRRVRFGWYTRRYLSVPRDGRGFRDEDRQERGLALADGAVRFTQIRAVAFTWKAPPDGGPPRLVLDVELMEGRTRAVPGTELQGVSHPRPPYIAFVEEDGIERRIEIPQRLTEEGRPPSAHMERLVFEP